MGTGQMSSEEESDVDLAPPNPRSGNKRKKTVACKSDCPNSLILIDKCHLKHQTKMKSQRRSTHLPDRNLSVPNKKTLKVSCLVLAGAVSITVAPIHTDCVPPQADDDVLDHLMSKSKSKTAAKHDIGALQVHGNNERLMIFKLATMICTLQNLSRIRMSPSLVGLLKLNVKSKHHLKKLPLVSV